MRAALLSKLLLVLPVGCAGAAAILAGATAVGAAGRPPETPLVERLADLPYAETANPRQTADLYLPKARRAGVQLPVVVFIHGGGWGGGSKDSGRAVLLPYVESGDFAGVSIAYRLSGEAGWPAQIHDCKAAIRWIRAVAGHHGLQADRIAVMGNSAGGTLATLLGTSGGVPELEGDLGPHGRHSSRVTCVVNRYGRLDFLAEPEAARAAPSQAAALTERLQALFRGPLAEQAGLARLASPIFHVSAEDPPVLTLHGTEDALVPIVQAEKFDEAMRKVGAPHVLVRMVGAGHGFDHPEEKRRTRLFLDRHLRGIAAEIPGTPIVAGRRR